MMFCTGSEHEYKLVWPTYGAKTLQQIEVMQKDVQYDIFVYIHKVCDALDWGSALEILERCGVVPQVFQLLTK